MAWGNCPVRARTTGARAARAPAGASDAARRVRSFGPFPAPKWTWHTLRRWVRALREGSDAEDRLADWLDSLRRLVRARKGAEPAPGTTTRGDEEIAPAYDARTEAENLAWTLPGSAERVRGVHCPTHNGGGRAGPPTSQNRELPSPVSLAVVVPSARRTLKALSPGLHLLAGATNTTPDDSDDVPVSTKLRLAASTRASRGPLFCYSRCSGAVVGCPAH